MTQNFLTLWPKPLWRCQGRPFLYFFLLGRFIATPFFMLFPLPLLPWPLPESAGCQKARGLMPVTSLISPFSAFTCQTRTHSSSFSECCCCSGFGLPESQRPDVYHLKVWYFDLFISRAADLWFQSCPKRVCGGRCRWQTSGLSCLANVHQLPQGTHLAPMLGFLKSLKILKS